MDEFVKQLAERLHIYDADIITTDETREWPKGKLDELVSQSILKEIQHSKGVVCDQCEENCFIEPDIRINPETGQASGVFVCTRNPDVGRIEVDLNRLRRWRINKKRLSQLGYSATKTKPERQISREQKRQNEKLQLHAALLKHHGFGSDNFDYTPATQKDLQELTHWNQPKVHRVMKVIFGDNPMNTYKQRCRTKTITGFLKKSDDGSYSVEAIYDSAEQ